MLTTPAGKPASLISWARKRAERGDCSAVFMTTVFPVASAGPSFQAAIYTRVRGRISSITAQVKPTVTTLAFVSKQTIQFRRLLGNSNRDNSKGLLDSKEVSKNRIHTVSTKFETYSVRFKVAVSQPLQIKAPMPTRHATHQTPTGS